MAVRAALRPLVDLLGAEFAMKNRQGRSELHSAAMHALLYDAGARLVRSDLSIELVGKRRIATGPIVAFFVVSLVVGMVLTSQLPILFPFLLALWASSAMVLRRLATRRVVFDASAKMLHVLDRGLRKRDSHVAFPDIRALTVEQREPRRVADAPRVLTVNGEELLSVKDTFANANLERELQLLVGLPFRPSPKDTDGWTGF